MNAVRACCGACTLNRSPQVVAMGNILSEFANLRPVHGASAAGCAGPLPPPFFVHAEDDQPEDHCCRSERSEDCNIEEQTVSEWRIQESQPAQFSKHRQDAQNARQTAAAYAPGWCCSHAPALLPIRHLCFEVVRISGPRACLDEFRGLPPAAS